MSWIQTYTGKQIWPLAITPKSPICIEDIAHALSMKCRFNGHCNTFYCPAPEERVLGADLIWRFAGDLRVGDKLIGFDESPTEIGSTGKRRRRFRPSIVTHTQPVKRRVIRLEMEDGSTVCASAEHPWLVATKASRNQAWKTCNEIAAAIAAGSKRYMHKFVEPWKSDRTWESGWLAGMYDGEGFLSVKNRGGVQLGVSQKTGPLLDLLSHRLLELGFSAPRRNQTGNKDSGVFTLQVSGGWREMMRLLGTIRPQRLLKKFSDAMESGFFNKQMDGLAEPLRIIRAYEEGTKWVSGLETSTHTYICEGFGAHNSIAEHCVRVSQIVRQELKLCALLHDAVEAYLPDFARPIKGNVFFEMESPRTNDTGPLRHEVVASGDFVIKALRDELKTDSVRIHTGHRIASSIESDALLAIHEALGIPLILSPSIKQADTILLATEARDLMGEPPAPWELDAPELTEKIIPWSQADAKRLFLEAYETYVTVTKLAARAGSGS